MRNKLIVGNWKMNLTLEEARRLTLDIRQGLTNLSEKVEVAVCPSFVHLANVHYQLPSSIKLGSQNVFWKSNGAYTGEISCDQLLDLGCSYVIVGHSERRKNLRETDDMVNDKVLECMQKGLKPIICVGETNDEKEKNMTEEKVTQQVELALEGVKSKDVINITIAYEPIWAIGNSNPAEPSDAQAVISRIRDILKNNYSEKESEMIKILYGGSVNPQNIASFVLEKDIDGALVGGASIKANEFVGIVKQVLKI
ncbi:MAG: triose-phosphate isomerase [Patescibacteria group bacterium]|jgi:triosephosphate isomerase